MSTTEAASRAASGPPAAAQSSEITARRPKPMASAITTVAVKFTSQG